MKLGLTVFFGQITNKMYEMIFLARDGMVMSK